MIIGSLLVPSIGGGVCQTATTLFNNAFELGLPITERHNHSFYISHYPLGRDATVSWGGPDFGFANDLEARDPDQDELHGLDPDVQLLRHQPGPPGRRGDRREGELEAADDELRARPVRAVGLGAHGRGLERGGLRRDRRRARSSRAARLVRKDSFTSSYVAVGPTTIYGPGRSIPGSYFVLPKV